MRKYITSFGLTLIMYGCEQPAFIPVYQAAAPDDGKPDEPGVDTPDAGAPVVTPEPIDRVPRQLCGDGLWDSRRGETCDDGNTEDGDGCSGDCSAARCLVPVTHASVQAGVDDASCPVLYVYSGRYLENVAVRRDLTITAVGAERVTVYGSRAGSVLDIRTASATLQSLTVQGGKAERGGGVYFEGDELTLVNMKIHDNTAAGALQAAGGGIFGQGSVVLIHSQVVGNHVTSGELGRGGGVYSEGPRIVLDEASVVADNRVTVTGEAADGSVEAQGGGIFVLSGELLVIGGSSVSQNQARAGNTGAAGPAAARGGGVALSSASLELAGNSSVHGNRAEAEASRAEADGGGVFLEVQTGPSQEDNFLAISVAQASLIDNRAIARSTGTATGAESIARGGALFVSSRHAEEVSLTITEESRILDNRAEAQAEQALASAAQGGGIHAVGHGSPRMLITARDLMLSGNTVIAGLAQGGACYLGTQAHDSDLAFALQRSTVSDNRAETLAGTAEGGAMHISAKGTDAFTRVELTNSTLSNNQSRASGGTGRGGGVSLARVSGDVDVTVSFSSVTVADNQASTSGGGLDLTGFDQPGGPGIQLRNTILADNAAPVGPDCATAADGARVSSQGYNLIGTMSDCSVESSEASDLVGVISGLGPLAGNGSAMRTHSLMSYSPAINAGHPDGCLDGEGSLLGTDQCGRERVGRCDIGASEYAPE
jgi:cysteine-rich repeat protein